MQCLRSSLGASCSTSVPSGQQQQLRSVRAGLNPLPRRVHGRGSRLACSASRGAGSCPICPSKPRSLGPPGRTRISNDRSSLRASSRPLCRPEEPEERDCQLGRRLACVHQGKSFTGLSSPSPAPRITTLRFLVTRCAVTPQAAKLTDPESLVDRKGPTPNPWCVPVRRWEKSSGLVQPVLAPPRIPALHAQRTACGLSRVRMVFALFDRLPACCGLRDTTGRTTAVPADLSPRAS